MVDYVATQRASARARARPREASLVRNLDWALLLAVAGLVAFGLWAIAGITKDDVTGDPNYYVVRQAAYALIGAAGMLALVLLDPGFYRRHARALYGLLVALLVIVPVFGQEVRNTRRWIDVGPLQFQPSEFGKLLLVVFLAAFLAERGRRIAERQTTLAATGLALAPILLVFLQPDFGTAIVYAAALGAALFVAGTRWAQIAALLGVGVFAAAFVLWIGPSVGVNVLKDYQRQRIVGFTNPSENPSGSTWNITQSITAVGAGGPTGRGVSGATQTNSHYLPEHATDFAFASLAEQRGFSGAAILLLLYLLVIWRAIKVITLARDAFAAIAAGGIAFALLVQIFINVGMTIGMAPITGIPLPFVSVGGSSMVANLLAIGILQAICLRRR
ncbi:MAG TPA: rod shape-determining protein RodA [Gaiellaceae bacterium]|jgi:rod shape determining protein RodA|nr:rod shape-determining protein RodA [Gaiellaceae bacterium]